MTLLLQFFCRCVVSLLPKGGYTSLSPKTQNIVLANIKRAHARAIRDMRDREYMSMCAHVHVRNVVLRHHDALRSYMYNNMYI